MVGSGVTLMANQNVPGPGQAPGAPVGGGAVVLNQLSEMVGNLIMLPEMQGHLTFSKNKVLNKIIIKERPVNIASGETKYIRAISNKK